MAETTQTNINDRRARQICLIGIVVQVAVLLSTVIMAAASTSAAIWAEAVHMGGGVAIWLALLLVYTQRTRAASETLETEELKRAAESGASTAIFESTEEALHIERHRLAWMYRWLLPVFTVALALFHIGMYVRWQLVFGWPLDSQSWTLANQPPLAAVVMGLVGFVCFLFSRYASGMARIQEWKMLRAASAYLAGNALACLVLVVALGLRMLDQPLAEPIAAWVIWIGLAVLGVEFGINFMLDIYRPRVDPSELRPGFDSRLLSLVSEPGGIARSIADAINYQFGFEVSATWFYQLMQRAMLPLVLFTVVALIGLSSVVIIDADQQAVVERFGNPQEATLGPGLHLKLPWPIDRVRRDSVSKLRTLIIGSKEDVPVREDRGGEEEFVELWTEKHVFAPHMMILVADEVAKGEAGNDAESNGAGSDGREGAEAEIEGGVMMVKALVSLQYKARDLRDYLYNYRDPEAVLEAVAYQSLTDYAAGVDIDHLIGRGRADFEEELREYIQNRVDNLELGVDVVFLGLQGAHPPFEEGVAAAFQNVIAAESRKEFKIEEAKGTAQQILSQAAGSVDRAEQLDAAVREMDRLLNSPDASEEETAEARRRVNELLMGDPAKDLEAMSGEAAAMIARAEADRTVLVSRAESRRTLFESDLAAYQAAPLLYKTRKTLDLLKSATADVRKVITVGDPDLTDLIVILEPEREALLELDTDSEQ